MTVAHSLSHLHLSRWQIILAAALMVGGFVVATQIRTERAIREHLRVPSTRLSELAILLQKQERYRASLEVELGALRAQLAVLAREAAAGQSSLARLNRELRTLRTQAGFVALEGPGVLIEMHDSPRPIQPGDDPNKTILHYTDIHAVMNDLWAVGAEAIALNGERIMTRTGINCVGTTILCNTKRIAPPYTITAIGDPTGLLDYLSRPGSPVEILKAFEFPVRMQAVQRVTVPAYRGVSQFSIARPVTKTGAP